MKAPTLASPAKITRTAVRVAPNKVAMHKKFISPPILFTQSPMISPAPQAYPALPISRCTSFSFCYRFVSEIALFMHNMGVCIWVEAIGTNCFRLCDSSNRNLIMANDTQMKIHLAFSVVFFHSLFFRTKLPLHPETYLIFF